jgi:[lysine-biosynthesis-protein LysW]---L-2-aminoadipate ligase
VTPELTGTGAVVAAAGVAGWCAQPSSGCVWIAAGWRTDTNDELVDAVRRRGVEAWVVEPRAVDAVARSGDSVLGRLDVRRTLDGIEDGLEYLQRLEGRAIRVLNRPAALLRCHDKLQTALRLGRLGLPHPATVHLDHGAPLPRLDFPVVVKPRFGSWGSDVFRCTGAVALAHCLRRLRERPWFRQHSVLLQEVVPPVGFDLRVVVAGGRVVGAIERVAAPGEWRTNVALGGCRRPVDPSPNARRLALAAATAVEADLVGVDLMPLPDGGHVVLELNGAVDFTSDYSPAGRDVFDAVAAMIAAEADADLDAAGAGR